MGNQTYTGKNQVTSDFYRHARRGDSVTVVYLPDRPEVCRSEPSRVALSAYSFLVVTILGNIVAVVAIGLDIWKRRNGQPGILQRR